MVIRKVKIPIYEVNVTFIELDKEDSDDCVLSYMLKIRADNDEVESIRDSIKGNSLIDKWFLIFPLPLFINKLNN